MRRNNMDKNKYICPKCGKVEVPYKGAYCEECKGTFEERCSKLRSAMSSVKETGDWREDWEARKRAINGMFM